MDPVQGQENVEQDWDPGKVCEPDDSPPSPPFHIDLIDIRVRYVICVWDSLTFSELPLMSRKVFAKSRFSSRFFRGRTRTEPRCERD